MSHAAATSELRTLVRLAWPVVVGQLGLMLMGVTDTVMVGRLDPDALAGVALGHTWSFAWLGLGLGAAMGLDPAITQAWGARDQAAFGRALAHGTVLLAAFVPVIVLAHLPAEAAMRALGQPESALPLTGAYCEVVAWSAPAMVAWGLLRQALQAQGRMWPATWLALAGNGVNVVANGVLLYGWGTGVSWGAVGSAYATTAVRWVLVIALAVVAWREVRIIAAGLGAIVWRRVGALAAIAVPVAVQVSLEIWAFTAAAFLVGRYGDVAVAAHMVTINLASLSFMLPLGISAAATTRVGHQVGAGEPWAPAAWTALSAGGVVMLFGAAWFVAMPTALAALYVPDGPEIVALAAALLPVAAAFSVFDGVQVVAFGILRGLGDTRVPALANIVAFYVVGLPAGAWLGVAYGLGPRGVWIGMAVALGVVSVLLVARIRWWTTRTVVRVDA